MKSFQQFTLLAESPLTTYAAILQLVDRGATDGEIAAAKFQATRFALKNNLNYFHVNLDDPSTFKKVYQDAERETRGVKASSPSTAYQTHPSDKFLVDIRNAAMRQGFADSSSSNYIIHYEKGYLGFVFHHKKYPDIKLMVPTKYHYIKEPLTTPFWLLKHDHMGSIGDFNAIIGKGTTVAEFERLVQQSDFAKLDADAKAEKKERDRPKHSASSPEQLAIEKILTAQGFTLNAPFSSNQGSQYWTSADQALRIYVPQNGDWTPYNIVGGKEKKAMRDTPGKRRTPADLEAFLKKSEGKEAKAHVNPELDQIMKFLVKMGFKKIEMQLSSATQFYSHPGVGLRVEIGRNNFRAKGRITKDEPIYWTIAWDRSKGNTRPEFKPLSGEDYVSFLKAIHELATFENGPAAIEQLVKEYGFKPMDIGKVADQFRDSSYLWFHCGTSTTSRGTVVIHYLGYHKATGNYKLISSGILDKDWLDLEGRDIATLRLRLAKDGIKPGQNHANDDRFAGNARQVEELVAAAKKGGFNMSGNATADYLVMVHGANHLYSLKIMKTGHVGWVLIVSNPGMPGTQYDKVVATSNTTHDLEVAISHHIGHVRTLPEALLEVKLAATFQFATSHESLLTGDDFIMHHSTDGSILEITKETAGWEHFWKRKLVGHGMSTSDLKLHLVDMYG